MHGLRVGWAYCFITKAFKKFRLVTLHCKLPFIQNSEPQKVQRGRIYFQVVNKKSKDGVGSRIAL
jgi:hypothetical protein